MFTADSVHCGEEASCLHDTVLRMSLLAPDFRAGKARGATWTLLNTFLGYKRRLQLAACADPQLQDQALLRFTRQPNVSVLRLAVSVFDLAARAPRYEPWVARLCAEGQYKAACDAAVCLELHDVFPIHHFCVPLLLQDNCSTMETYLNVSPKAAEKLINFLDNLTEDNCEKVSELIERYPKVKPIGANKLSHKPLDKMIRKFAEKWAIAQSSYPKSADRWAKVDLYYWIKQMFGYEENNLPLVNWREIIEKKVGDSQVLKEKLVADLYSFDIGEANYWAKKYGIDDQIVTEVEDEEENWEEDVDQPSQPSPTTATVHDIHLKSVLKSVSVSEDSDREEYLKLPFPEDNIILVTTRGAFLQFLKTLQSSEERIIGMDAEFMSTRGEQNLSLIQVSLSSSTFLLDWEVLPCQFEDEDYRDFKRSLFLKDKTIIVGFGILGDVRLLEKASSHLEDLSKECKNLLDLESVKTSLMNLLRVEKSPLRGLAGLCKSVLGKPLSKAEQIGDWSKRPLRRSQLVYAALDAWVCVEIFRMLQEKAKLQNLEKAFDDIVAKELNKVQLKKEEKKSKEKKIRDRDGNRAELEKTVPDLMEPLLKAASEPGTVALVCDNMLQGLCRKLRMFGVDCLALDNGQDHLDCVTLAQGAVTRYVVSRGSAAAKIAKQLAPGHTLSIRSDDLALQVEEVFRYFNIVVSDSDLFSRCVLCNGGHYYQLSRAQLTQISDNILRRKHLKTNKIYHVDDFEEDFNDDLDGFLSEESDEEPCLGARSRGHDEKDEGGARWQVVPVVSAMTGADRAGRVNMATGRTEEEVSLQVESLARATLDKYPQFWVCGQCGKIYFEGSHWEKASAQARSIIKE